MTDYDCFWYEECTLTCDCNKMVPYGKLQKGVRDCFTSGISSKVELQKTEQDFVEYGHGGGSWIGPRFRTNLHKT